MKRVCVCVYNFTGGHVLSLEKELEVKFTLIISALNVNGTRKVVNYI